MTPLAQEVRSCLRVRDPFLAETSTRDVRDFSKHAPLLGADGRISYLSRTSVSQVLITPGRVQCMIEY